MLFVASCKGSLWKDGKGHNFFHIYGSGVKSKLSPLITHFLLYGVMGFPMEILCVSCVVPEWECACYYSNVVFCVSPVSLCLGWWKSVRQATQRKGFTWVRLCWRMASSTMVSSHSYLHSLRPLRPAVSSFAVPDLTPNLPQLNLLCAARRKRMQVPAIAWLNLWPCPMNVPHSTSRVSQYFHSLASAYNVDAAVLFMS